MEVVCKAVARSGICHGWMQDKSNCRHARPMYGHPEQSQSRMMIHDTTTYVYHPSHLSDVLISSTISVRQEFDGTYEKLNKQKSSVGNAAAT